MPASMQQPTQSGVLEGVVARVLAAAGSSAQEARTVAANLVLANLSGHDSHGVGMCWVNKRWRWGSSGRGNLAAAS